VIKRRLYTLRHGLNVVNNRAVFSSDGRSNRRDSFVTFHMAVQDISTRETSVTDTAFEGLRARVCIEKQSTWSRRRGMDSTVDLRDLSCRYEVFSGHFTVAVRPRVYLEMLFLGENSLAKRALEVWTCRCVICHHVLYMVSWQAWILLREANVGIAGCTAQDPPA
jgi:hypothetical protein